MKKDNAASKEIGLRIAQRRKQLGLTQEQLAEQAEVSAQFIACVERGQNNMRAENIVKLSAAMQVSTDYILTGKLNEVDRSFFMELLEPLTVKELHCLEEIVKNYLIACGHDVPKQN